MYNLEIFTKMDVSHCAVALRNLEYGSKTMEDTANQIVRYLYDGFLDPRTGKRQAALVRFFKTHPYQKLSGRLQQQAQSIVGDRRIPPATKCLTLLATAGDKPEWNVRQQSSGHQAIPLIDEDFVRRAPMILQLIQQFGLEVSTVIDTSPTLITRSPHRAFNVFHIPHARNSPHIPAQREFVTPFQIKSVLGFGGMLPTNELFTIIMFTKAFVPIETANRFKFVSAYVRVAIESFTQDQVLISEVAQR